MTKESRLLEFPLPNLNAPYHGAYSGRLRRIQGVAQWRCVGKEREAVGFDLSSGRDVVAEGNGETRVQCEVLSKEASDVGRSEGIVEFGKMEEGSGHAKEGKDVKGEIEEEKGLLMAVWPYKGGEVLQTSAEEVEAERVGVVACGRCLALISCIINEASIITG
ncbi:hypothetical protein BDZ91DRAFT_762947 [Kalaharituber pfeilii]|nr:hypothetical protein BDZ91DRAFT_762947 [Kalaharituber pfeilii]